jgi:hypothetical protein
MFRILSPWREVYFSHKLYGSAVLFSDALSGAVLRSEAREVIALSPVMANTMLPPLALP